MTDDLNVPLHVPEPPQFASQDDGSTHEAVRLLTSVRNAEEAARAAEADRFNRVGMCLQEVRGWAAIPARDLTAAIAWSNAENRHVGDRNVPRGGFAFWTGGSEGSGHIAMSRELDGEFRSTDAGGSGVVASRTLAWFDEHWPSLTYVGWTDNVNGFTVPGVGDWFDMATEAELRAIVRDEIRAAAADAPVPPSPGDIAKAVCAGIVREASGGRKALTLRAAVRETFEKVTGR